MYALLIWLHSVGISIAWKMVLISFAFNIMLSAKFHAVRYALLTYHLALNVYHPCH